MRIEIKKHLVGLFIIGSTLCASAQHSLYLIPGVAIDHQVYQNFTWDSTVVNPIPIKWIEPKKRESLEDYAMRLMAQIDTTQPYSIAGISMGGFIAKEIAEIKPAEKILLISSAQHQHEISFWLRIGRRLPLYRLMGDRLLQFIIKQPITWKGIEKEEDKQFYYEMISGMSAKFIRWQMYSSLHWKSRMEMIHSEELFIIHGSKDTVIPMKNLLQQPHVVFEGGTHKTVVNHSDEISALILKQFD